MVQGNMMNALSGFERLLLFLGLLLLSVYAVGRIYSSLYSHLAVHEFWGSHGSLTTVNPAGTSRAESWNSGFSLVVGKTDRGLPHELSRERPASPRRSKNSFG